MFKYDTSLASYARRSFWGHLISMVFKVVVVIGLIAAVLALPMFASRGYLPIMCLLLPLAVIWVFVGFRRNITGMRVDWDVWHHPDEKPKRIEHEAEPDTDSDGEEDIEFLLKKYGK